MSNTTRILHEGHEFLVVQEPGDLRGLRLTFLARPEDERFVRPGTPVSHEGEHGSWCRVASIADGLITVMRSSPPKVADEIAALIRRFRVEQARRRRQAEPSLFYVVIDGKAAHLISSIQLHGILLRTFSSRESARAALLQLHHGGRIVRTGPLREFFATRAQEGFAGAIIDDKEPVFWCLDGEERSSFMRVGPLDADGDAQEFVLDDHGRWKRYEGETDLFLYEDQESWDQRMVADLGQVPWQGCEAHQQFFALRIGRESVVLPDEENEGRFVPLFTSQDQALEFLDRRGCRSQGRVEEVSNLREWVEAATAGGSLVQLNPGSHRARTAALWASDDGLVFDTFSGLWHTRDGSEFTSISADPEDVDSQE